MWPKASSQTHILSSCNKIKTKENYMHWVELHVLQRVITQYCINVFTIYSALCCRLAHRMPFRTPSYEHRPFNDWTWTMWHRVLVNQKQEKKWWERKGREKKIKFSLEILTFHCNHKMLSPMLSVQTRSHLGVIWQADRSSRCQTTPWCIQSHSHTVPQGFTRMLCISSDARDQTTTTWRGVSHRIRLLTAAHGFF